MRILILETSGNPALSRETGGGTANVIGLAREWAEQGHAVTILTNSPVWNSYESLSGVRVRRFEGFNLARLPANVGFYLGSLFNLLPAWRELRRVWSTVESTDEDVVALTVSPLLSDTLLAAQIKGSLHATAAVYFHHIPPSPLWMLGRRGNPLAGLAAWGSTRIALAMVKIFDLMPVLDQPETLEYSGWRFSRAAMRNDGFLSDRGSFSFESSCNMRRSLAACYIGRVSPGKGTVDLVVAWRDVIRELPDARLEIYGPCHSARFLRRLSRMIRHFGLGQSIGLHGFASPELKRNVLLNSRIFPFPSYEEGWSLSVMEAAARGAIPVVYDLPAYSYLGDNAIRVPVGDRTALAAAIGQVLRSYTERQEQVRSLVRASLNYSSSEVARQQISFFKGLSAEFSARAEGE